MAVPVRPLVPHQAVKKKTSHTVMWLV